MLAIMFSQQAVSNRFSGGGACTVWPNAHRPELLPVIEQARKHLFGDHKPADTVVGVETLAQPGYLIEVDAIAVTGP